MIVVALHWRCGLMVSKTASHYCKQTTAMPTEVGDLQPCLLEPRRRYCGSHLCDAFQKVSSSRALELGVTGCVASHGSQEQSVQKGEIQVSMEVRGRERHCRTSLE
jgi:hypothetical protein